MGSIMWGRLSHFPTVNGHFPPILFAHSCNTVILNQSLPHTTLLSLQGTLSLVDRRLSGDGTGKALGINDPVLGFIILFTVAAVWSLFSSSSKNMGGQRDEDGL